MSFAGASDERLSIIRKTVSAPVHEDGFSSAETKSDERAALICCTRLALEPTADCTRPWRPAAHEPLTPIETRCYGPNRIWSVLEETVLPT